jgi:hypothetical protein
MEKPIKKQPRFLSYADPRSGPTSEHRSIVGSAVVAASYIVAINILYQRGLTELLSFYLPSAACFTLHCAVWYRSYKARGALGWLVLAGGVTILSAYLALLVAVNTYGE